MNLDQQYEIIAALGQAMRGSISPNFRAVNIEFQPDRLVLTFVLAEDDPLDREEIEEIIASFDVMLMGFIAIGLEYTVKIIPGDTPIPEFPGQLAYRRRER